MINKLDYAADLEPTLKKAKKKLELQIETDNLAKAKITPSIYDLGKAPLAPDTTEPNVVEIDSEIRTNKPAFLKSKYEAKTKDAVVDYKDETDTSEDDDSKKSEAESKDYVGAGTKTLDFVATAAQKKQAMGRKERNAQTMNLVGKGASTGAAIGSVIPGVGTVIGAGVGAVAGGIIGLAKGGKAKKLEDRRIQKERNDALKKAKYDREVAQKLFGEQEALNKQNSIVQAQQAVLKSKY
jgi:outer membrane lipoprotein SlyB